MKSFLILAVASQLFIHSSTLAPHERVEPIRFCDLVGTHTDLTSSQAQRRTKQCICNPGFYGYRCEKIYRCRSGRALNMSCVEPDLDFVIEAAMRCIKGQVDLEVCECFVGYEGPLCQDVKKIANDQYAALEGMGYGEQNYLDDTDESAAVIRIGFPKEAYFDDDYDHMDSMNDPPMSQIILLLVCIVLIFVCFVLLWKTFQLRRNKDKYVPVSTIRVPKSEFAPPPYTKTDEQQSKSFVVERDMSRTSTESSDEALPMPPSLRPYLHV